MFKRILLPIDGSEHSLKAASKGLALAAASGAQAIGLEVLKPLPSIVLATDAILHDSPSHTAQEIRRARGDLSEIALLANDAGVAFEDGYVFDCRPYAAIAAAADRANCDLIVIGAGQYANAHREHLSHQVAVLIASANVPVLVWPSCQHHASEADVDIAAPLEQGAP